MKTTPEFPAQSDSKSKKKGNTNAKSFSTINPNAAGIDIGADSHWVSVPQSRDSQPVRRFGCFTSDLYALAKWLKECQIETVAMESTGVYWIPLFQILETQGLEVKLVNMKSTKKRALNVTTKLSITLLSLPTKHH
jgi:transposase